MLSATNSDFGATTKDPADDYPDFGKLVARYKNTTETLQSDARLGAIKEAHEAAAKRQQGEVKVDKNTTETVQSDARLGAIEETQEAVAKRQQGEGRLALFLIGSAALILLISVILHGKKKIVFFADYTDATMTFLGSIALVIFIVLFVCIANAFITNPDEERRLNDDAYQDKLQTVADAGIFSSSHLQQVISDRISAWGLADEPELKQFVTS